MDNFKLKIYTDGGARGNPGPAAYGFVIYKGGEKISEEGSKIGVDTNNIAEYMGVISALLWVKKNISTTLVSIDFFLDSQLVVRQLTGVYKIKNDRLKKLFTEVKNLEEEMGGKITYESIPREKNYEADRMVNQALDNF